MTRSNDLFQELRERRDEPRMPDPDGHHLTTGYSNSSGPLRIFQDLSGDIGLFIPLGRKDPATIGADRESRAITLQMTLGTGTRSVEIRLQNPALESVFHVFVDTYLQKVRTDPENAASIAAAQLKRWRALFMPVSPKVLSQSEEIGLLCELEELKLLLETEGSGAFYRWTGPDRQAHDFRFDDRGIECKATLISEGLHVTINGANQLTPEPGRRLLLTVRKYDSTPNGDISLKHLISELTNDTRIPADLFLMKLSDMGVHLGNAEGTTENLYLLQNRTVFEIVPGFPRLYMDNPSERIKQVSYGIDLTPPEEIPGFRKDGSTI